MTRWAVDAQDNLLFPARRRWVRALHQRCFRAWGLPHRELADDDTDGFAFGWELVIGSTIRIHYLLGADAPYGAPTVRVMAPEEAKAHWNHVESNGTLCLLEPGRNWMPLLHDAAVHMVLRALFRIIELNVRGSRAPDPVAARHRWLGSGAHAWSVLDPSARDASFGPKAVAGRLHERWVIASTPEDLHAWLEHRGLQAEQRVEARVVEVSDFEDVPHDVPSLGDEERSVLERGGVVAFVLPTAAGPLMVGVHLEEPGVLERMRIDRADRRWIHERGGIGLATAVAEAHVALVGCGSLGGGVAELLARAGVGQLTLIDPESLSWDNVARHALGGTAVGRPKAVELARRIRAHLPTIPRVTGLPHTWQHVAAHDPQVLRADLVVSTIAAWPDELALSEWTRLRGIPLVLGWVEPRAAAGHAVSLRGRCLSCQFTPRGGFLREVAKWDEPPIRLAGGCHEHFLPYGYADVVPTQSMIVRLALGILTGESSEATHRALVPSARTLTGLGAQPSSDTVEQHTSLPSTAAWTEQERDWPTNPGCWHCGGTG